MPGCSDLFKRYISDYFIETGSCYGDGVQSALDAGFENVVSIELSEHLCDVCRERFQENPCVRIVQGDSSLCLYQSIKDVDCKMTFWLDGHYSGRGTAISATKQVSPLLEELDQIKAHPIKDHIILIDDMRLWIRDDAKFDEDEGMIALSFGSDEIIKKILEINEDYTIRYEDDVCGEKDILIAQII